MKHTVLVVEQTEYVRTLLEHILTLEGYDVTTASGPQEVFSHCTNGNCFDLFVCDVRLPVMDGHELARWISSHCPRSRVIHVTGDDRTWRV